MIDKINEDNGVLLQGHIKIFDPTNGEIIVDKRNAIHYENMSEALALCLANKTNGFIHEMHFGNGGTSVDPTGVITYLPANNTGQSANLYNPTYYKVVDDTSSLNTDPVRNKMQVSHTSSLREVSFCMPLSSSACFCSLLITFHLRLRGARHFSTFQEPSFREQPRTGPKQ